MAHRVDSTRLKEVFQALSDAAIDGANIVMDKHVEEAKRLCPVGKITRKDTSKLRNVVFVPKKGRGKGKIVDFIADTWMGRQPGSLKATIRKVEKYNRAGNIRCYAGNKKVFYARFVEYGTSKTPKHPFMRPSFQSIKGKAKELIEAEMKRVPEVK
jgi:HK97 gp10 family phage protein